MVNPERMSEHFCEKNNQHCRLKNETERETLKERIEGTAEDENEPLFPLNCEGQVSGNGPNLNQDLDVLTKTTKNTLPTAHEPLVTKENNLKRKKGPAVCACLPQRYVVAAFVAAGMMFLSFQRGCSNLALNKMTFKLTDEERPKQHYCPEQTTRVNKTNEGAEFHWDQHVQHDIIRSIFIGHIAGHIPGGLLADRFGGKQVFGGGLLLSSLLSLTFPLLARWDPYAYMGGRILQGFGQGIMFPCMSAVVAKWAPPNERSRMSGIVQSGTLLGGAVGYIISGIILSAFKGWEPVFYFAGFGGLLYCAGWYTLCFSSPAEHPFITEKEKTMIESQIALKAKQKPKNVPWKSILTSLPLLSLVLVNVAHTWATLTMKNELPTYMGKVLNFDVKQSGFYSALPNLTLIPSAIGFGYIADRLTKNFMHVTTHRRLFAFLGNTLPIPFLIGASYAGCDRTVVIILFMSMMFFKGISYSSSRTNPVDLSPNYAGILFGIMNGIGGFSGLVSPYLVPFFITGDGSIEEWRNFFLLSSAVMFVLSIPYVFFGSGEVQPWNDVEVQENTEHDPETRENNELRT